MTIEQTVEIPPSRRLTIEVPREIPPGRVTLTFTPEGETRPGGSRDTPEYLRRKALAEQSMDFINRNAEWLNRQMEDTLKDQVDMFELGSPFTEDDFVLPCTEDKP
ncbi:MAG: hypothetical protein LBG73_02960 [Spirochaetaceae bacterium]|jgi:hypothetical protein|nr:hypothetical protein [Spirochaetaceae bacterium]